jgi:hypothetical protein
MDKKKRKLIGVVFIAASLTLFGFRVVESVQLKQNCTGYLKRAADANTIELATVELDRAITYLEANGLTTGYTSILWRTPDEDIDFWYRNLVASRAELTSLAPDATALERTNVLIKLRETLTDSGEKTKATVPGGLAVYPNNLIWAVLMWFAAIGLVIGFGVLANDQKAIDQPQA